MVGAVINRSQVFPFLHGASEVDLVERELELSGLIGGGEPVVVVHSEH